MSDAIAGMALVALGLVLTPGPNMLYLVGRSITQGRAAGLVSLAGVAVGFLVYLAAAVARLSAVFVAVPSAYTALKIAGAGYLLYLAWRTLSPGATGPFAPQELRLDPPGGCSDGARDRHRRDVPREPVRRRARRRGRMTWSYAAAAGRVASSRAPRR